MIDRWLYRRCLHPNTYSPHRISTPARARGCYMCTHFHGRFLAEHLACERRAGEQIIATPCNCLAFWEREPEADDEM
jgi:hypothetical protein